MSHPTDKQQPIELEIDDPDVIEDAVHGATDSAFEATPEFGNEEHTPAGIACPHCGSTPLILIKDNEPPPRSAVDAWKIGRCLSTHDRSLWSFCRQDGKLREHMAGATTSFDRRRSPR